MARPRFPHPLVLLFAGVLLAAVATWMIPAGQFDRHDDPETHKSVVVAGTYHGVARQPVNLFQATVALPEGMVNAADIIFFVFLVGGAFTVVDKTGALRQAVNWLATRLENRRVWVIPVVCVVFATGGALENLQEEILAMVPVLLLLCQRLGYDPLTAAAMSIGAASVGSAFSPVNPFQANLALRLAQLPGNSGAVYRSVFLVLALGFWIWATARYARRTRTEPGDAAARLEAAPEPAEPGPGVGGGRTTVILVLVGLAFAVFIYAVLKLDWSFEQTAAIFFVMGALAGLVGRLGMTGTAEAFVEGFRSMAYAAVLIGFARAIFVVLDHGRVIDTLISALFSPLAHLPVAVSALGMLGVQTLVHLPVPSVSGQAVLTLPVLVPLADLLGMSRQVVVLAYQYGAGLCELLIPTNGALMAILGATRVRYEDWLRFVLPVYLGLLVLSVAAILLAVASGLR